MANFAKVGDTWIVVDHWEPGQEPLRPGDEITVQLRGGDEEARTVKAMAAIGYELEPMEAWQERADGPEYRYGHPDMLTDEGTEWLFWAKGIEGCDPESLFPVTSPPGLAQRIGQVAENIEVSSRASRKGEGDHSEEESITLVGAVNDNWGGKGIWIRSKAVDGLSMDPVQASEQKPGPWATGGAAEEEAPAGGLFAGGAGEAAAQEQPEDDDDLPF